MPRTVVHLIISGLLFTGCGGPPKSGTEQSHASDRPPIALVFDGEISGQILQLPLREPTGLAVDSRGYMFVSDAGNHRIVRFGPELAPQIDIGGFGSGEGALDRPSFLVVDNNLNLVVSDVGNKRLSKFDSQLHFADEIELFDEEEPLKYGEPAGVALTEYGELWYADWEKGCLVVFDNVDRFDRYVGNFGYTGGQLSRPEKLIHDANREEFVVCDAGNGRLVIYDEYGNFESSIVPGHFKAPVAVAQSGSDRFWILDGVLGQVALVDRQGTVLFETGSTLAGDKQALMSPSDIVVLPDGRLVISDTGNNRLVLCRLYYPD